MTSFSTDIKAVLFKEGLRRKRFKGCQQEGVNNFRSSRKSSRIPPYIAASVGQGDGDDEEVENFFTLSHISQILIK